MAKILRIPVVLDRIGIGRSTLYELLAKGDFPASIPLGARSVGFLESEIDEWIESRARRARGVQSEAEANQPAA